jgi:hypothetical protein
MVSHDLPGHGRIVSERGRRGYVQRGYAFPFWKLSRGQNGSAFGTQVHNSPGNYQPVV